VKFMKHTFPILIFSFELARKGQNHSTKSGLFSLKLG
jgi:hypothetical protein